MKALRKSPLKRSGKPLKRTRIKKKPRSKSEFARIYHSKGRVEFIKSLPCCACGIEGFSDNAHVAPPSEKGTGYKGHYRFIAPLCGERFMLIGCHRLYDEYPMLFKAEHPDFDPEKAAADCEKLWLEHSRSREAVK